MSESTKRFRYDTGCIIDNQTGEILTEIQIRNRLNQLHDENTLIKQTIEDAIRTERTNIGKSVLKQLMDRIQ